MSPGAAPQDLRLLRTRFSPHLVRSLRDTIGRRRTSPAWNPSEPSARLTAAYPSGTSSTQFDKNSKEDDAGGVPSKAKQKKLGRESAALSENQLPCEAGSSIFLRHDPDRFDRMRAVTDRAERGRDSGQLFRV